MESAEKPPILHIIVVGFHHKFGCQVEFSYPPLIPGTTGRNECPSGWKYLSTLALPDGSHNFTEDTVFFNLPSLSEPTESIYGVSCYRQISVDKLKIRTADVTRSTVQKSVCCLSRLPIYGYIEVKLSLITDTFFDQGDFSCTDLLIKAYQQLNACLLDDESHRPLRHFYVGLPLRDIMLHWRHKTLLLFKLFLLQRRVVCFGSPVRGMCVLILGIASLIPRLLEKGFQEVACVRTSRPLSPMPDFTDAIKQEHDLRAHSDGCDLAKVSPDTTSCVEATDDSIVVSSAASAASHSDTSYDTSPQSSSARELNVLDSSENVDQGKRMNRTNSLTLTREASVDTLASTLSALAAVNPDEYRAPITIFASGNLCLPYLSLPYMDLLTDPSVLSYVIGTSNVLFQQKRQLADVLVDIENASIETHDPELRRQLVLSTEDLRFMDFVMRHVQAPKEDAEGSEHWIRDQFQGYILSLLRTAVTTDATSKDNDHFNAQYMQAFKRTQCFQEWYDVRPEAEFFEALPAGHPFAGTLSVADMKLKIAQTMQNSESGRKINQAVNTTSRAVGGALSQAKGAFSNWWSSIITIPAQTVASSADNMNESVTSLNMESGKQPQSSQSKEQQPLQVSSTFQNSQNVNDTEGDISIHVDRRNRRETINSTSNGDYSSGSEKLVDSAEEIGEDGTDVDDRKNNVGGVLLDEEHKRGQQQPVEGIVEIGKEAVVLDKSGIGPITTQTTALQNRTSSGDSAVTGTLDQAKGGDVFIV